MVVEVIRVPAVVSGVKVFAVPRCAGWLRDERIADGHRDARVAEYLSDSCIAHVL
jgi:hypothetical protein